MTNNHVFFNRNSYGVKCAEKLPSLQGALRHTRQCDLPTGQDAFKAKVFILLLAGSLKTGGVFRAGANGPRLKARSGLAKPRPTGPHLGPQCFIWPKKQRSCLTVLMFSLAGACGKAAANTARSICGLLSMKWFEVPNAGPWHSFPLKTGWLKEEQHQEQPPEASQAKPRQPGAPSRGSHKRRDHNRRTDPTPSDTPQSKRTRTGRTRQRTTTRTKNTHNTPPKPKADKSHSRGGTPGRSQCTAATRMRRGAEGRVVTRIDLLKRNNPTLRHENGGQTGKAAAGTLIWSLLFLSYIFTPGVRLRAVAAALVR